MAQSIIVYRNPIEAMFWESGLVFPLIVGVVAAMVVAVLFASNWQTVFRHNDRMLKLTAPLTLFLASGVVVATMVYMT